VLISLATGGPGTERVEVPFELTELLFRWLQLIRIFCQWWFRQAQPPEADSTTGDKLSQYRALSLPFLRMPIGRSANHGSNKPFFVLLSLLPNDRSNSIIQDNLSLLKSSELLQNVPNPFSGSTQIWFKLEKESLVSIHIFDYTGKKIKTIHGGMVEEGIHSMEFSTQEERLSTGLYFYSLEVNGQFTDSKKMTILR
jgi:hypothetical protein